MMPSSSCLVIVCLAFMFATCMADKPRDIDDVTECFRHGGVTNFTTGEGKFETFLNFSLQNSRFADATVTKPAVIIIPESQEQVRRSVVCCVKAGLEIRVRSGGHSYEGLSYTSDTPPFALLDLMGFDKVHVDTASETAWVEAGATLGQVFFAIGKASHVLGFPAGICPTVGSGGQIAGGGLSFLSRKYGLSADNIVNALLVNASGEIMDKETMGDDVFWALRGGGGGSWGVVIAWQFRLVRVPRILTAFNVPRNGSDLVTELLYKWQFFGPKTHIDLFMRVQFFGIQVADGKDMKAKFQGIYLGRKDKFLNTLDKEFPELAMTADECSEMSWVESDAFFSGTPHLTVSELMDRYYINKTRFKIKSDMGQAPMPKSGISGLFKILEEEVTAYMIFSPLRGIMDRIPATELPFPHRKGNIFDVQYKVTWNESSNDEHYIGYMRKLYAYMEPYVSKNPRSAYVNYLDLDLGFSANGTATVEQARAWGMKYFHGNYDRLVKAKSQVDPHNYFRNPQSIPPRS